MPSKTKKDGKLAKFGKAGQQGLRGKFKDQESYLKHMRKIGRKGGRASAEA